MVGQSRYGKIIVLTITGVLVLLGIRLFSAPTKTEGKAILEVPELVEGDVVLRLGDGFFSDWFRKYASREKKYSHIGLVTFEEEEGYVLHSEANELTGIGGIKKEKLTDFLKNAMDYGFYRMELESEDREQIMQQAKQFYAEALPFDLHFDNATDDELYCTEFVAKSINWGLKEELILPTLTVKGKRFFSLDDVYGNKKSVLLKEYIGQ